MSMGLYKYLGSINDRNSKLINIASQRFYEKYWEKAIKELKIKYIQDGAEFGISKKKTILKELDLLLHWANTNLKCEDLKYMKIELKIYKKLY